MNRILVLFLIGFWISCNQNPVSETVSNESNTSLVLNEGKKWLVNEATDVGIKQMQERIAQLHDPAVEDYQQIGNDLYAIFQHIFNACDMEGPGHDELHKLLTPMMGPMQKLKGCTSLDQGKEQLQLVQGQISLYFEYFYFQE